MTQRFQWTGGLSTSTFCPNQHSRSRAVFFEEETQELPTAPGEGTNQHDKPSQATNLTNIGDASNTIPNNAEELHPLIQDMLDWGGNNLDNDDIIGVMAAAPMIDDNNQPPPENLLSTEDSTGATNDIMGLWTHSSICEWKGTIQRNAKPELTFWTLSLSNPLNLNFFEGLFFLSFIKTTILPQTNQNLPHGEKPILYGEFLHWIGLWMLMGTIVDPQRRELWATSPIDVFHGAHLRLGIWMTQTRLEAILSALTFTNIPFQPLSTNFEKYGKWLRHCRILGLTTSNSLLQYANWLVGRFVLSTIVNQNKKAWLQESKLAKMLCTSRRELGTNRWKFLPKVKHFIF